LEPTLDFLHTACFVGVMLYVIVSAHTRLSLFMSDMSCSMNKSMLS